MGTQVLRPQDCLIERVRVSPAGFQNHSRRSFYPNGNGNGNGNVNPRVCGRKPVVRPVQKQRFEKNGRRRSASLGDLRMGQNHHHPDDLVMGQVTILTRGDQRRHRPPVMKSSDDLALCGTVRLGPDPGMAPTQVRIARRPDLYAGSAFSMSPSPSSLPVPSFLAKKHALPIVDVSATRDLRRLLRLD